jgi:SAM-dependent methyltransferase
MSIEGDVARHYGQGDLTRTVVEALRQAGKDPDALRPGDISGVDEFHTGWRPLTLAMAPTLGLRPGMAVLDVGSGVGGPARHFAGEYGCEVTGIDLTPDFVDLANDLTRRTGLADRARFVCGSALEMPFAAASFDLATMMHVGMNIADKARLFGEVHRVLRPGGRFVLYDLMRVRDGALPMPMPWAPTAERSFVETPERYRTLLAAAGFGVTGERDWSAFVLQAAEQMRQRIAAEGPPVIGLHLLMGPSARELLGRVVAAIADGMLAPTEMVAEA